MTEKSFAPDVPKLKPAKIEQGRVIEIGKQGQYKKKIEDSMLPDVMAFAAEPGITYKTICKKVEEKFGITITQAGIRRIINLQKSNRAEHTQAVLRENIGEYIITDLEILKTKKAELVQLSVKFKTDADWSNYFKTVDRIKEYSTMLFDLSGANEKQSSQEADQAKQELMDTFDKAFTKVK